MNEKDEVKPIIKDSTLEGFAKLMRQHAGMEEEEPKESSGTVKGYADGGEVDNNDPSAISAALQQLMAPFKAVGDATQSVTNSPMAMDTMQALGNAIPNPMAPDMVQGVGNMVQQPPQDPPNMGEGPNVGNAQNGMPPAPSAPPMNKMMQNLKQTPDTNPSIYQGINADQRAALYKQLLDKQSSGGNLAAQAVGGIGDAISNSFGGQHNNFQNETRDIAAKNTENRIGSVDTQRQQKIQDMSAQMQQQSNDPNSPLSKAVRDLAEKSTGKKMPSMMPASMLEKLIPGIGELAMKQLATAEMASYHNKEIGESQANRKEKEDVYASEHPILNWMNPVQGASDSKTPSSNGWKIKR